MLKDCETNPKIVISTVPFVDEDTPLAAPAVLKASLQTNGFECVALDLNIEIFNKIKHRPDRQLFLDFFYWQKLNDSIVNDLVDMLNFYAEELLWHKPTHIGLSLFSSNSQTFTAWLCAVLRQKAPDVRIVIGGPGLQTLENSLLKFPDRIKKMGLIDDYIAGDGEVAIVEYLKGNLDYPGINTPIWEPIPNFNQLPIPDFSDYRFFSYAYPLLPIIDSRGCVQNCEFCDVISFWKKFQYLTADKIFGQMLKHIEKYNVYRFQFSSSICNGNFKEFKKLLVLISDYNKRVSLDENIHWVGSFIIRPATQHNEDLWVLIKKSNGFLLTGVESIVEHVRINLGKNFNNADLDHHLEMGRKYQVPMNLLMIASYPTETAEDYKTVKQWFKDHKEFANNTVMKVQVTLPGVLPGTRLEQTINHAKFRQEESMRKQNGHNLVKIIKQCGFNVHVFF